MAEEWVYFIRSHPRGLTKCLRSIICYCSYGINPSRRSVMPQPSANATVPRQFRLAQDTLDLLDRIAAHYTVKSRADAIRIAARIVADQLPPAAPKKSRKIPKRTT
jgi:hypothetical protein